MSPPVTVFQSRGRGRQTDQSKSDSNYKSFYNIKKTNLSARYPFLPKKQIERKIKHLWERASAEKRATLCLTSSGTTAKSPFKGSILRGLCKKKVSVDLVIPNDGHLGSERPAYVGGKGPVRTLRSSIKSPHPQACREKILRSSEKKHVSTRRVSFSLEQSLPSRPNTRSSILEQKKNEGNGEKSKTAEDGSQGYLKKRVLSLEEKKMYEFEDVSIKSFNPQVPVEGGRMTQLRTGVEKHVFDPEEYNLESTLNSKMFNGYSQSPTITPGQGPPKPTERRCKVESAQKLAHGKKTCNRRNTTNPTASRGKDQVVKSRNKPKDARKGNVPSTKYNIDTSQSDDTGEVPWMVTACPDSSSDEVKDDDDHDEDAIYEYYHKSSSGSSAPTLPTLSQESEDILCSPYENDTMFSWNGVSFTKKSSSVATDLFDSQLSLVSMDAAEVMSISTEASLSVDSPPSEFGFLGKLMSSPPQWSLSLPDNMTESVVPPKRRMRLRDGATVESPRSSRYHGLGEDDMKEAPTMNSSPSNRKRKMRGQGGEDIVAMTTARKSRENSDQPPVLTKQPVASQASSLVPSNQRKVLAETNSRIINPAPMTNRTKRVKEDDAPAVKTKRSGRMRNREGITNGSHSEECPSAERGLSMGASRKAQQLNCSTEDLHDRDRDTEIGSKMNRKDAVFKSDGILCDLFQPNISSQKRSFNPPREAEFYQSCMDPVSSHLFLEENFFL